MYNVPHVRHTYLILYTDVSNHVAHMLTHGAMQRCGLTSWVDCINDKFCDIREINMTIKSDI